MRISINPDATLFDATLFGDAAVPATPDFDAAVFDAALCGDPAFTSDARFWRHTAWRHFFKAFKNAPGYEMHFWGSLLRPVAEILCQRSVLFVLVSECSLWALHARTLYDLQWIVESAIGTAMTPENSRVSSENTTRETLPKCCTCHEIHTEDRPWNANHNGTAANKEERVGLPSLVPCTGVVFVQRCSKMHPIQGACLCGRPLLSQKGLKCFFFAPLLFNQCLVVFCVPSSFFQKSSFHTPFSLIKAFFWLFSLSFQIFKTGPVLLEMCLRIVSSSSCGKGGPVQRTQCIHIQIPKSALWKDGLPPSFGELAHFQLLTIAVTCINSRRVLTFTDYERFLSAKLPSKTWGTDARNDESTCIQYCSRICDGDVSVYVYICIYYMYIYIYTALVYSTYHIYIYHTDMYWLDIHYTHDRRDTIPSGGHWTLEHMYIYIYMCMYMYVQ